MNDQQLRNAIGDECFDKGLTENQADTVRTYAFRLIREYFASHESALVAAKTMVAIMRKHNIGEMA